MLIDRSDKNTQILKEHWDLFFLLLAEQRLTPKAAFNQIPGELTRCLSGIPFPFNNTVFGCPHKSNWDDCIREQLAYFKEAQMPFVWLMDEGAIPEFKALLMSYGFQDCGKLQGVIGPLDQPFPSFEVPANCVLEQVKDRATMDEFNELVCATFGIQGVSKDLYRKALWNAAQPPKQVMCHWVAKQKGRIVSALSTFIAGDLMSFWNGASLPEVRRQGLWTSLCYIALRDALSKGCRFGSSYLMPDGMARGICRRLGFQTKWEFCAYIAPYTNCSR